MTEDRDRMRAKDAALDFYREHKASIRYSSADSDVANILVAYASARVEEAVRECISQVEALREKADGVRQGAPTEEKRRYFQVRWETLCDVARVIRYCEHGRPKGNCEICTEPRSLPEGEGKDIAVNLPFERIPQCACDPGTGEPPTKAKMAQCRLQGGPCSPTYNDPAALLPTQPDKATDWQKVPMTAGMYVEACAILTRPSNELRLSEIIEKIAKERAANG